MMNEAEVGSRGHAHTGALLPRAMHLVGTLGRAVDFKDLPTGDWFAKTVSAYLRHYETHELHAAAEAKGTQAEVTEDIIHRACVASVVSGSGSASVSNAITVLAADKGLVGALVAIPASGLTFSVEMLVRAIIHLRMCVDLASAFDLRLDPADLSRLYAIVLEVEEEKNDGADLGRGRVAHLMHTGAGELGGALGAKLLGESMARNFVPLLNVVTSSAVNWRVTRRVGDFMLRYVRLRRALEDGVSALRGISAEAAELLMESAWFLFVSDGRLRHDETAVLTHALGHLSQAARRRVLGRLVEDEAEWLRRLHKTPPEARDILLESLKRLSAADLDAPPAERALLQRAAEALGGPMSETHVDALMRHYHHEGVARLPPAASRKKAHRPPEGERLYH